MNVPRFEDKQICEFDLGTRTTFAAIELEVIHWVVELAESCACTRGLVSMGEDPVRVMETEPVERQTIGRGWARIKVPAPADIEMTSRDKSDRMRVGVGLKIKEAKVNQSGRKLQ